MKALTRVKIKVHIKTIPEYILVLLNLAITAWITGKYAESICFAFAFVFMRYKFENILHCQTTFHCALLSNGIVHVFVPILIPITNSLFGGLISGFAVNYFANLIASNFFREKEKKELIALRQEKFARDVYSLDEAGLRSYCKSHNLDTIDEEIVIQRLIHHLRGIELYGKIGYSKPQMIRREKSIEAKLGIKLK